jgi:T-complex protein 1 subunit theta
MNKMVINHIEKLFVTNDAATIVNEMEIVHPAAKMVVLAAGMQQQEVGDGSNLVIALAGELLKQAGALVDMGLHPSEIISGFELANTEAYKLLEKCELFKVEKKQCTDKATLIKGIRASVAAKQYGYEDMLSGLIADAATCVMPAENPYNFSVDNVRVAKVLGGNVSQSRVIRGMVVGRDSKGTVKEVQDARVAVFNCCVDSAQTETKGTVLLSNADDLLNYSNSEEKHLEDTIKSIADAGVNVIICKETVGEMALHFCNKYNVFVLKIQSAFEMRRLCRAMGATAQTSFSRVPASEQGTCKRVYVTEVGADRVTVFANDEKDTSGVATILLRASTLNILNDLERAVDDGVNTVKALCRDGRFVAGGGAAEIEVGRQLIEIGEKRSGLEQYAIKAYGRALEVVARTLGENAGLKSTDLVAQLYAAHDKGNTNFGVDIANQGIVDMTTIGVYDHLAAKANAMRLASNAAITILRVDQIIMAKQAGGPKMPQKQGHWDDLD